MKFNLLTVIEFYDITHGSNWRCICDCGTEVILPGSRVSNGYTKSCGCLSVKSLGLSQSSEYQAWKSMRHRCRIETNTAYPEYGGRGINVSSDWYDSFEKFYTDMGPKPSEKFSLDRIDVDGDYCKENCRWADKSTQQYNQRVRKNNQSGRTGVSWDSNREKWTARIRFEGKEKSLGRFDTFEEAVKAREDAELQIYGVTKN